MFTAIYFYRVPGENAAAFLAVQRDAAAIYRHHGALDDETFAAANLAPKYGCAAFDDALEVREGEVVFVALSRFRDRAHHDEVMARVDADPRITGLYNRVTTLLDVGRIVRGEFERVV